MEFLRPEIRGETDIMIYGEELHNDLQLMQEEERDTYIAAYRQKLSAQLSASHAAPTRW